MGNRENEPTGDRSAEAPLPPELVAAIKDEAYACVSAPTNAGTAYVIKAPRREIDSLRGPVPVAIRHELHSHPLAPVIRTLIMLYDQPAAPMALESFISVADAGQRADFERLARQAEIELLFFDEQLRHQLSKRVRQSRAEEILKLLAAADRLLAGIPPGQLDFDRAKRELLMRLPWPPGPLT